MFLHLVGTTGAEGCRQRGSGLAAQARAPMNGTAAGLPSRANDRHAGLASPITRLRPAALACYSQASARVTATSSLASSAQTC